MRVVSRKGNKYEIIANEAGKIRKFVIVDNKILKHESFQDYLLRSVIGFDRTSNPVRRNIDGELIEIGDYEQIQPVIVKGDWIKLEFKDITQQSSFGWVRWRDGDHILVLIYKD